MKIVLILGGFLSKRRNGEYGSDRLSYLRVLAGYYLYKNLSKKNKVELIVSGGKGIYEGIRGVPSVATVMKQELVMLGIKPKEVKIDETDFTYPELIWLKNRIGGKEAFVVSNAYHLPRIRTMINFLPELKKLKTKAKLVSAEKTVLKFNNDMRPKINNLNKSPEMEKMIASEKKGIKDLKSGNYKFKT